MLFSFACAIWSGNAVSWCFELLLSPLGSSLVLSCIQSELGNGQSRCLKVFLDLAQMMFTASLAGTGTRAPGSLQPSSPAPLGLLRSPPGPNPSQNACWVGTVGSCSGVALTSRSHHHPRLPRNHLLLAAAAGGRQRPCPPRRRRLEPAFE